MEQETFTRIKEDLHPLGAVDANGLNYNKLAQRTSLWHLLCLGSLCASRWVQMSPLCQDLDIFSTVVHFRICRL